VGGREGPLRKKKGHKIGLSTHGDGAERKGLQDRDWTMIGLRKIQLNTRKYSSDLRRLFEKGGGKVSRPGWNSREKSYDGAGDEIVSKHLVGETDCIINPGICEYIRKTSNWRGKEVRGRNWLGKRGGGT